MSRIGIRGCEAARAAVVSLAWLVTFLALYPAWDISAPTRSVVMLMSRGEANPAAQGKRVVVASFPDGFPASRWSANFDRAPASSGDVAFPLAGRGVMALSAVFGPGDSLVLRTGRERGTVDVSVNGEAHRLDLYRDGEDSTVTFRPYDTFSLGKRILVTLGVLPLVTAMAIVLFGFIAVPRGATVTRPRDRWDTVRLGLPCLGVCGVVLAGTWPGQMSLDTLAQWDMLRTGNLSNHHPVAHTFLFVAPSWLLGTPAATSVIQVVMLSLAFGWLLATVHRLGTPYKAVAAASVLIPLLPAFHLLSTVLAKDVPYAVALLAMTTATLSLSARGGVASRRLLLVLAGAVFLAGSLRHNGLIVVAGFIVVLAAAFPPMRRLRSIFVLALAGLGAPLAMSAVVVPLLGAAQIAPYVRAAPAIHVLAAAASLGEVDDPATVTLMEEVMPLRDWARLYRCQIVDTVIFDKVFARDRADSRMYPAAMRWAITHPVAYMGHLGCVTGLLWKMNPPQLNTVALAIDQNPGFAHLGLPQAAALPELNSILLMEAATAFAPLGFLVWSPALLLLLLAAYLVHRWGLPGWRICAIACMPVFLNTVSLAPFIPAQELRYQYPVFLVVPVIVLMLHFLPPRSYRVEADEPVAA